MATPSSSTVDAASKQPRAGPRVGSKRSTRVKRALAVVGVLVIVVWVLDELFSDGGAASEGHVIHPPMLEMTPGGGGGAVQIDLALTPVCPPLVSTI